MTKTRITKGVLRVSIQIGSQEPQKIGWKQLVWVGNQWEWGGHINSRTY